MGFLLCSFINTIVYKMVISMSASSSSSFHILFAQFSLRTKLNFYVCRNTFVSAFIDFHVCILWSSRCLFVFYRHANASRRSPWVLCHVIFFIFDKNNLRYSEDSNFSETNYRRRLFVLVSCPLPP